MRQPYYLLLCVLVAACARPVKPVKWQCEEKAPVLETLSYNAGLAPGVVPLATPRTKPFLDRVGSLKGVGLICLQEVWLPDTRDAVIRELGLPETHVMYEDTGGEGEASGKNFCAPEEIDPVIACAKQRCGDVPREDMPICGLKHCRGELVKLYLRSRPCLHCIIATAWLPMDEARKVCTDPAGAARAFGGHNGMILASRWPLRDREAVRLPSSGANRVGLLATVEIPGHEPVEIGCAHLSSQTYLDPLLPRFDDWQDEMAAQFMMLSRRMRERAGGRPQILLGDMNTGPARSGYGITWPPVHRGVATSKIAGRVWRTILREGFESPVTSAKPPFCTSCADNTLRGARTSYLIDHVLHRDPKGGTRLVPACTHPYFDEEVPLVYPDGAPVLDACGDRVRTPISDHYGVVVKYRLE